MSRIYLTATYPGTCQWCGKAIRPKKSVITRTYDHGWVHRHCYVAVRSSELNKQRVMAGETYRSQAPSRWRLRSRRA